jgi:ATP-dependent DNA helicase RecQ
MLDNPLKILNQYWGFTHFRPTQEAIIDAVISGKDVLALLPTGGGKSICFQVPGMLLDGICLVVSPLIALMKDQAESLEKKGITVATIHSGLSYFDVKIILQNAIEGEYKFIYLSPERLETKAFKEYLPLLKIGLVAVDEAHCVSQWGYDFRPSYLKIANIREFLPDVPLIALTASAVPEVQEDIVAKLGLKSVAIFRQSFNKPNLSYSVFHVDSKLNKLIDIVEKVPGSSIIYCNNRRQTKNLAYLLNLQNISADFYHAGLSTEERAEKQQSWVNNKTRVIVCTNAFGLGIDKPDVRTVIHFDAPECLENYYQEAGRAGRDGERAYAILLYQTEDIRSLEALPIKRYPLITTIRKVYQELANYLQLPVGLGEGQYFDFEPRNFSENFQLEPSLVNSILKILEQEGHCSFSEKIFLPSQVFFTTDKDTLNEFQESHPQLSEIIKTLLRSYEGIFNNQTSINEKNLSHYLRIPVEEVLQNLMQLKAYRIIDYLPQKENPQIHFHLNRAPADYLLIKQDNYLARKKQYEKRLNIMLHYIQMQDQCRSNTITKYFGEAISTDCGICDNCLSKKRSGIKVDQFKAIEKIIKSLVAKPIHVNELLAHHPNFTEDKILEVLRFMESEGLILIDEAGLIIKT